MKDTPLQRRGRGALTNVPGRFEVLRRVDLDDGWHSLDQAADVEQSGVRTYWQADASRSILNRNQSPDIDFDVSINPYRGCEHGCIYCFARPSHAWLGHSPGLDFERRLYAKTDAARLLRQAFDRPRYRPEVVALGVNTDAWQPLERRLGITRSLLEVFLAYRHPVSVITKSSLIERDIDLLSALAADRLTVATITLTTLDNRLSHALEPRATAPARRLRTIEALASAGIPVRVSLSPIIPAINEPEIESLVAAAADAGASGAYAIPLRLPHEVKTLFEEWLREHFPDRTARVLKAIRSMRGQRLNDPDFGTRMTGQGPRAELIFQRLALACRKHGLTANQRHAGLDVGAFRRPVGREAAATGSGTAPSAGLQSRQMGLFD